MTLEIQQKLKKQSDTRSGYVHSSPLRFKNNFGRAIKTLSDLNPWKATWAIACDWYLIAGCFLAFHFFPNAWVGALSVFIIAGRQHGLLILMHDAAHYRITNSHIWNDRISNWLMAYPLFVSTEGYRANHLAHHWHLNTNKDPDWIRKKGHTEWEFPMPKTKFIWLLIRDLLGGGLIDQTKTIININKNKNLNVTGIPKNIFQKTFYYVLIFSLITLFDFWGPVLLLWFLPALSLLAPIMRMRSVARHFGLKSETDLNMSRNYFPSWWERFFIVPHNVGYHLDHHLYPSVPFYNLPALHALLLKNKTYQKEAHQNGSLFMNNGISVLNDISNPELQSNLSLGTKSASSWIQRIIQAARLAPSGDNCQPWEFSWNGKSLFINHNEKRAKHAFNRSNHASYLSLGCILESIMIAARHEHLKAKCHYDLTRLSKSPYAQVEFEPNPPSSPRDSFGNPDDPEDLYPILFKRTTDRRPYNGGTIDHPFFDQLVKKTKEFNNVSLTFRRRIPQQLIDILTQMDCFVWEDKAAHDDFFKWVRMNRKEVEKTKDGMSIANLGANFIEAQFLKLCQNFKIQQFLNPAFTKGHKIKIKKLIHSSAGLGCISVRSTRMEDLIEAGGLWMQIWCQLTRHGYGLQPFTSTTFPIYDGITGVLPPTLSPSKKDLFQLGHIALKQTFDLNNKEIPIVLFRTGVSPQLPEKMRTLRKEN